VRVGDVEGGCVVEALQKKDCECEEFIWCHVVWLMYVEVEIAMVLLRAMLRRCGSANLQCDCVGLDRKMVEVGCHG
jgi:hypothetical protein